MLHYLSHIRTVFSYGHATPVWCEAVSEYDTMRGVVGSCWTLRGQAQPLVFRSACQLSLSNAFVFVACTCNPIQYTTLELETQHSNQNDCLMLFYAHMCVMLQSCLSACWSSGGELFQTKDHAIIHWPYNEPVTPTTKGSSLSPQ